MCEKEEKAGGSRIAIEVRDRLGLHFAVGEPSLTCVTQSGWSERDGRNYS